MPTAPAKLRWKSPALTGTANCCFYPRLVYQELGGMELEDALNLGLPPHDVQKCVNGNEVTFRAEVRGYPQCAGTGATPGEAVRVARHLFTQLRDGQTAVTVSDMEKVGSERLREAVRLLVTRALA